MIFVVAQKEAEITEQDSLLLTRNLLQIAIFNISYIRGLYIREIYRLTEDEVGWVLPWDYGNVRFMGLSFGLWKLRGRLLIVELTWTCYNFYQSTPTKLPGRIISFILGSGWTNKSFTLLIQLLNDALSKVIVELPDSLYEAKKMIRDLGLDYVKIDACRNNCIEIKEYLLVLSNFEYFRL
uniref:Uncharacterized protein n=1 Tax=Quercus lobata TaxID=97700 RepID=A0A7N2LVI2_QUELO